MILEVLVQRTPDQPEPALPDFPLHGGQFIQPAEQLAPNQYLIAVDLGSLLLTNAQLRYLDTAANILEYGDIQPDAADLTPRRRHQPIKQAAHIDQAAPFRPDQRPTPAPAPAPPAPPARNDIPWQEDSTSKPRRRATYAAKQLPLPL